MRQLTVLILVLLAAFLAACGDAAQVAGALVPTPSPTDCDCDLVGPSGTPVATPPGGFSLSVPAGPGADVTSTPAPVETFRDRWATYLNPAYNFSFAYPAVYGGQQYGYCAPRAQQSPPEGSVFVLDVGSRTRLTLSQAGSLTLQEAVEAFQADPSHDGYQFYPSAEREVGGKTGVSLSYRAGDRPGGAERYGESTFFLNGGLLYRIDTGAPSACDVAELELTEITAAEHILDTFSFP